MRAMVMQGFGAPLEIRELPDPVAPAGAVVVEVRATGLCRSDWHGWIGHDTDVHPPHVPGHELAGVITEVGEGVATWRVGDRVTVPFVSGCGECEWCRSGNAQVCPDQRQPGFTYWGSFAEYVTLYAADTNLVRIPDSVSFEAAAALGCRFATAFRALTGRARVRAGEWVTVVGAGGVGLSAVMIAKALGARVVAIDRHDAALEVATSLGADAVIVSDETTDVPAAVHALNGGSHVAVDAVGSERTMSDSVRSLRRLGRHVQIGLLLGDDLRPRVPMPRVIAWELELYGSHGMPAADYPAMLALIEAGTLRPQDLIERTVTLEEGARLLPHLDSASPRGITIIDPRR